MDTNQCADNLLRPSTKQESVPTNQASGQSYGRKNVKSKCQKRLMQQVVGTMFEKKFHYKSKFENGTKWSLPHPDDLFQEFYQINTLLELKERLNGVKSKLNDFEIEKWSAHTRRKDPSSEVPWRLKNETNAEFVTIAWCKFFECLHNYPLVNGPKLNSLHLCEAPGAFIAALNHYLHSKYNKDVIDWNWLSTTLNPYYEGNPLNKMINDDRFILYTLKQWIFHNDFTGNIMNIDNISNIQRQCANRFDSEVHLVTADGSVDCVEKPGCQEEFVASLHFAEIITALTVLAEGGCFVIKMFTMFEAMNVSKIYLLNCIFHDVHIFKPATSKRGNSEVYVICLGYKKSTMHLPETLAVMKEKLVDGGTILPMFRRKHIPQDFLIQHEISARMFMNLQIQAIEASISSFNVMLRHENRYSHQLRSIVANEFYKRYNVKPIKEEDAILYQHKGHIVAGNKIFIYSTFIYTGSYSERELVRIYSKDEHIFRLRSTLNELEKSLSSRFDLLLDEDTKDNEKLPIQIYTGLPYSILHSSLFVSTQILVFRIKLQEILTSDPIWCDDIKCILDDAKEVRREENNTFNYYETEHKFFTELLTEIYERKPHRVVFKNYPFLTHYAVSLLRSLSSIFNHIVISTESLFEVILEATDACYSESAKNTLFALHNALMTEHNILCVLDILQLHRNKFSKALTEYNNRLLMKNFKLMLET